jgi:O-antigen/teichoic acid export membrane protein
MPFSRFFRFLNQTDGTVKTKTIRAGLWVGISSALFSSLSFIRSVALARLLSPEVFGLWAICMMCIRGIDVLTQTGFSTALIHRGDRFDEAKDTAFTLMVIRGFVLAVLLLACAPLIAGFFGEADVRNLLSILAVSFVFIGFVNINTVRQQKELDFRALVFLDQARTLTSFALVVGCAFYLRNIWALVVAHVASTLIHAFLSYWFIEGKIRFRLDKAIAWELFHYGKYITGLSIAVFLTTEIDNAVIGKVLGMEMLGFYVLAYTLANLPATHFSKVLSNVLMPAYSKLQNDPQALQAGLHRAIKFIALVSIPISFMMIVLADDLVSVVYGDRWLPASKALQILAIFGMLRAISSVNGYLYNAIGKPNIPFYFNTAKLLVIAICIVPLTRHYGIEGAAMAITVPLFVQFFVSLKVLCRLVSADYWSLLRTISRFVLISSVMAAIVYMTKQAIDKQTVASLLVLVGLSALSFAAMTIRDLRDLVSFFMSSGKV